MRLAISLLMLVSALCLGLGLVLPIVKFEKLYFFTETPSLVTLVSGLWSEGSVVVALAVMVFSMLFPIMKLAIVYVTAVSPETELAHSPLTRWAGVLSKWSMMDVLLVALVIFAAKTSGVASAFAQPGLWFYATSAITGAVAAALLKRTA